MNIHESAEDYLEAILMLHQQKGYARSVDIAAMLNVTKPSASIAMKRLRENGYILMDEENLITLTPQGEAIARNLYEMSGIQVPILCLMIGEGGSGGALALAVGNQVWMMENATYSILSPEGFASILWKDGKRAQEAASVMKITAQDLKELHVIDDIIPEYGGADEDALTSIANYMKGNMKKFLKEQDGKSGEQLAAERYDRFRAF